MPSSNQGGGPWGTGSQSIEKLTSTMFSSPVSIRLSSGTSRIVVRRSSTSRMPISMRLTRVTLGVRPMGYGLVKPGVRAIICSTSNSPKER
jgi:hypothetical protein